MTPTRYTLHCDTTADRGFITYTGPSGVELTVFTDRRTATLTSHVGWVLLTVGPFPWPCSAEDFARREGDLLMVKASGEMMCGGAA